ncbi:MAG: GTP cyclohydrolase I [Bdellovibrionota bacterium]
MIKKKHPCEGRNDMKLEKPFNNFLGREMAKAEDPIGLLDERLIDIRKRTVELYEAHKLMASGYKTVLEALKMAYPTFDLNDPNITDSHNRMARALLEMCSGLGATNCETVNTTFPSEKYNEVILLKNIDFTSLCAHHFIPFTGVAHVAYLPDVTHHEGRVVGLSKLARIVDVHAQRPQLQERMCYNIMEALKSELKPAGVMVVVQAAHGCLTCRGARKANAVMLTSALDGKFKEDPKLRQEFLALIHP